LRRRFVESRGFSKDRTALERDGELAIEDLLAVQLEIMADPEVGALVPGTGGLRKIRARQRTVGRGKRGGVRIYYLDLPNRATTHLLAVFGKREKEDLGSDEKRAVAKLARQLREETR
jgi:hypothetical protein